MSMWTSKSLKEYVDKLFEHNKEYVDTLFKNRKEYVDELFDARDDAIEAASESLSKRLDAMNEFREQLQDQNRTFIPRQEVEVLFANLNRRVDQVLQELNDIRFSNQQTVGRSSGMREVMAWAIAGLGILAAVLEKVFFK